MKASTITLLLVISFDVAAFCGGGDATGKKAEWFHFLPGGGIVRLIQASIK